MNGTVTTYPSGSRTGSAMFRAVAMKPSHSVFPEAFVAHRAQATVSIQVLRALAEAVELAGVSSQPLLRASGYERAQLHQPERRVSISDVHRLVEMALDLTQDPALGLHWSERLADGTFVPISPLLVHAATLRQALEGLERFHPLLCDVPSYRIAEQDDRLVLHDLPFTGQPLRARRFAAEMKLLGFVKLVRYFDHRARPRRVSFDYAAPAYRAEYERVFDMPVHFDEATTAVVFDRALLDRPAPHKDADLHALLHGLAQRRLLHITQRTPYAQRVREFLVAEGWRSQADMQATARALHLSVRSLRRRLHEEGKSYGAIVNEAMAIVAKQLLRARQYTIQETAFEMGFSEASTFHRAFKRWTGTTPSAYAKGSDD